MFDKPANRLTNLQICCPENWSAKQGAEFITSHLRETTPELAAAGALGLLPVHQKLQNSRLHVGFLLVVVYITQRGVNVA